MKAKFNINTQKTIPLILGLVLLLLLSPCKVRNFIQAEIGVPQTEVANKSQSSISNSNCINLEITASTLIKEKSSSQHLSTAIADFNLGYKKIDFSTNFVQPHIGRDQPASAIPFYILYQNFKGYL